MDADLGEAMLAGRLGELEQSDFVEWIGNDPEPTYQFKHSLVQEIAYDSLLFSRRRELHRRVATHIESANKEALEPVYEALVHHFAQCRDNAKTRFYSLRAGDKARQLFAHDEAVEYYRRGLASIGDKQPSFHCEYSYFLERIGDTYAASGRHLEAARAYSQAVRRWKGASRTTCSYAEVCSAFGDNQPQSTRNSMLQHKTAAEYERDSDYELALRHLEIALAELPARHPAQAARIIVTKCYALYRKGLYKEAIEWGRRGLSLSRRTHDLNNLAYAYNAVASSYLDTGDVKKAIRYRELALRIYEQLNDLAGQAHANNNLGVCYQSVDQTKALRSYKMALSYYERVGNMANTAICRNNVGEVLLTMGQTDEALEAFLAAVQPYENADNPPYIFGLALVNLSRAYQRKRDYGLAFQAIQRGVRHLKKIGARTLLAEATLQQAEIELEAGDLAGGLRTSQGSLKEVGEMGNTLLQARGLRISGRIHAELGEYQHAEDALKESISLARRAGAAYEEGLSLLRLAELWRREKKDNSARYQAAIRHGTTILEAMGATADLSGLPNLH